MYSHRPDQVHAATTKQLASLLWNLHSYSFLKSHMPHSFMNPYHKFSIIKLFINKLADILHFHPCSVSKYFTFFAKVFVIHSVSVVVGRSNVVILSEGCN
jgi:hypothetical protein